jgi:hypothetical protein
LLLPTVKGTGGDGTASIGAAAVLDACRVDAGQPKQQQQQQQQLPQLLLLQLVGWGVGSSQQRKQQAVMAQKVFKPQC